MNEHDSTIIKVLAIVGFVVTCFAFMTLYAADAKSQTVLSTKTIGCNSPQTVMSFVSYTRKHNEIEEVILFNERKWSFLESTWRNQYMPKLYGFKPKKANIWKPNTKMIIGFMKKAAPRLKGTSQYIMYRLRTDGCFDKKFLTDSILIKMWRKGLV